MIIQASQNGPKLYSFLTRVTDDTEFKVVTKFYTFEILIIAWLHDRLHMEQGKDVLSIMPNTRIDLTFCFSYPILIEVLYELFTQFLRQLAYTVADFLACRPRDDPLSSQRDHSGHAKVIKLIFTTQLNFYL